MHSLVQGSEAQLAGKLTQDFTGESRAELLSILRAAPDDSPNDHLLLPLLVSTDAEILLLGLEALASKTRFVHDEKTSRMIREFSYGWPGDNRLDLLSCVLGGVGDTEQVTRVASSVHFEFDDGKLQIINIGSETLRGEDCLSIFNRLVNKFQVPGEYRFGLLTRIRFAKAFESTETRHKYVKIMILALQLRSEKRFMPGQLKKLVRTRADVPESIRVLAIQTLTIYGRVNIFSPADREIKVEAFLSGERHSYSAGYVEAMLRNSSPVDLRQDKHTDPRQVPSFIRSFSSADNVLTWLEKELEEPWRGDDVIETLMLSKAFRACLERYAPVWGRLNVCLVKLFQNSERLGKVVFTRAAAAELLALPDSSDVRSAFTQAVASAVIPSGWEVTEKTAITYFALRASELILKDVEDKPPFRFQLSDLQGGEAEHAKKSCEDWSRCVRDSEVLGGFFRLLNVILRDGTWNVGALKELEAYEGLDKLLAHVIQPSPGAELRDLCISTFRRVLDIWGRWISTDSLSQADGNRMIHRIYEASIGLCEEVEDDVSAFWPEDGLVKKLATVYHFLKLVDCVYPDGLILRVWKNVESEERRRSLASLLDKLMQYRDPPEAVLSFSALLVESEDVGMVAAAEVASKALKALALQSSSSTKAAKHLMRIFNHALGVRDDNIFDPGHLISLTDEELRAAVAWYGSSLSQAQPGSPGSYELLKIGELLTRRFEAAQELLKSWELTDLVDKLLEVAAADSRSNDQAAQTLSHLMEDDETLYHCMVYKIRTFMDSPRIEPYGDQNHDTLRLRFAYGKASRGKFKVEYFLPSLSSLAFREPKIFLQATADTCQFDSEEGEEDRMVTLKRRLRASQTESSRSIFSRLLEHLLARLDEAGVQLLGSILKELPVTLQAAVDAGTVERVVECSEFSRFIYVFQKYDRYSDITRAMVNVLSSPEFDLIKSYKQLPQVLSWKTVSSSLVELFLKSLKELDMDHPEAGDVAAEVLQALRRVLKNEEDWDYVYLSEQCFGGPSMSDASVSTFFKAVEASGASAGSRLLQDDDEDETFDEDHEDWPTRPSWRFNEKQLETLGKFLWLSPSEGQSDLSGLLRLASGKAIGSLLLRTLQAPGSSCSNHQGVPLFVLDRVCRLLHGVPLLEDDVAVALIPLLISLSKDLKAAFMSLEYLLVELKQRGKTYSITLSEAQVYSICRGCIFTGDCVSSRTRHVLLNLVKLDPSLSPAFTSCTEGLSTEIATSAMESLERRDYTYCPVVARLVKVSGELLQTKDAREHLAQTLDPLWRFIPGTRLENRRARPLFEAFFMAQTLTEPTASALELLDNIVKEHIHLVRLASPILRKWPSLQPEFSIKVELLRATFGTFKDFKDLDISRKNIIPDSYHQVNGLEVNHLRRPGNITVGFVEELGGDDGGLTREWYEVLSRAIGTELFTAAGNPSPSSSYDISYFKFAGRLVAKAIVDDQRLDIRFSPSFLKHLLGQDVSYQDIGDADYLRNLNWLLENHVDESMGLSFSVDVASSEATQTVRDLVAGGSEIPVTDLNKHEYVELLADYLLTKSFKLELDAFLDGFYEIIPRYSISHFLPSELELLICGLPNINVADLKTVAKCKHECQEVLEWFWDIVTAFDNENKSMLLKFITGSSKIPFGGIGKLSVGHMEGGEHYLPTSHTCENEILLPSYKTKRQLEEKLLLAICCESFEFV